MSAEHSGKFSSFVRNHKVDIANATIILAGATFGGAALYDGFEGEGARLNAEAAAQVQLWNPSREQRDSATVILSQYQSETSDKVRKEIRTPTGIQKNPDGTEKIVIIVPQKVVEARTIVKAGEQYNQALSDAQKANGVLSRNLVDGFIGTFGSFAALSTGILYPLLRQNRKQLISSQSATQS